MSNSLSDDTISEIVQHIEPTWTVSGTRPATEGGHVVYHLDVETSYGTRQCILKATPPDQDPTCGDEARLLAVIDSHTALRVPEVLGAVDEHERWPTPLFLASTLPGANYGRTRLSEFSTAEVARLARSTGRQLATLHRLDAVDAFGFVDVATSDRLDGGRPSDDVAQITVRDPIDDWSTYLDSEVDRITEIVAETRFADVVSTVRPVLETGIDGLVGPFDPVVARIDQSLDNLILDPETSAVSGWLDWEFCVAVTPAYDLAFVEHSLAGGHWAFLPDAPDYRDTIRSGLHDGYREAGPARVVKQARENYAYYSLLAEAHAMANFDHWFDDLDIVAADETAVDSAAANLRERVRVMADVAWNRR